LFRSVCRLPANFLNEGRYSITAIVGRDFVNTQVLREDVVSFDVHDTGVMRGKYLGQWLGVVRPRLPWESDYLGDDPSQREA
jgi:lipopolysaccharide transport system ATP-binding protein